MFLEALVAVLLSRLDDSSFRVRERADRAVTRLNNELDCRPLLRRFAGKASPEASSRVRRILGDYDNVLPTGGRRLPGFYYIPRAVTDRDWESVRDSVSPYAGCTPWPEGFDRELTGRYVRRLLGQGMTRSQAVRVLDEADALERRVERQGEGPRFDDP